MSTDVTVAIEVDRPREEVARYATDWENEREWMRVSDSRLLTDPPFGVGSRVARVTSFLGKRIEYVNEVVEFEERLAMQSVEGPFPMRVVYEFDDAVGGTTMRIRAQGDASGIYRLAGPLLARAVKRSIAADLERLKARLERERP